MFSERRAPSPSFSSSLLAVFLAAALTVPAPAQQVLVQNGATVEVNNGGTLDLQDATMDFGQAGATARLEELSSGRVTGGLLTAVRTLDAPSEADPAGLGAVLSTAADLGNVTVTRGHVVQTASNGNESIRRYYDISPSGTNSGLSATLTHSYADAELNGLSESALELFTSPDGGSSWSEEGFDNRNATANTVTLSGIESFSRWTLGSEASPLPVELARFEATTTQTGTAGTEAITLSWTTASENGNAGFEIERRVADEDSWEEIGYRESHAAGGTTTEAQTYRFTDDDLPYAADTLTYRLRQVDTDGSATLTDPVTIARGDISELKLKKTYPNPARDQITVWFAVPEETAENEVTLRLYDVLGRQVRTAQAVATAGRQEQQLSVSGLASGTYFLHLQAEGEARTQKLTVLE